MNTQLLNGVRAAGFLLGVIVLLSLFQANLRPDLPFALQLTLAAAIGFWSGACWANGPRT